MKKSSLVLLLLTFISLGFLVFRPPVVFGQNKSAEIEKYLTPLVQKQQFSGVILVSEKDRIIYEKSFGLANVEHDLPNRIDTRFGVASVTKGMTLVIAFRLAEEGKINLQDKLSKYIPDFPNADQITLDMLLQHRAGLIHRLLKPEEESLPHTTLELVEKAKLVKPVYRPNERALYSNTGYIVLTRVLEIAAGKNYQQLLQEYIFTPAGMKSSLNFNGETIIKNRAQEHILEAAGIVHSPLKDYSSFTGAGSVFSTAHDIYLFGEAAVSGKLGQSVKSRYNGVFASNGNENGFRCYVRIDANNKIGFVLISNLESGANDFIIRDLQAILEGRPVVSPVLSTPPVVANANPNLEEFFGQYRFGNVEFDIFSKDNQLFAGSFKLFPIGKDRFFYFGGGAEVVFKRDEQGKVKELEWSASFGKITCTKQS